MVEAVESRMQDMSKLELVGKPLHVAFSDDESDESSEQTDSEN